MWPKFAGLLNLLVYNISATLTLGKDGAGRNGKHGRVIKLARRHPKQISRVFDSAYRNKHGSRLLQHVLRDIPGPAHATTPPALRIR